MSVVVPALEPPEHAGQDHPAAHRGVRGPQHRAGPAVGQRAAAVRWSRHRSTPWAPTWRILRFIIAATVILLVTVPIAFMNIFFEMKLIAFVNLRIGPNRIGPVGHARVGRPRPQGAGQGGLHAHRRGRAGVHPGARGRLPRRGDDAAGHPVRARPVRLRHGHRAAVLLRRRRPGRGGPDDGRLVQLQQVLAAGRPARRGRAHQLRAAAHPRA